MKGGDEVCYDDSVQLADRLGLVGDGVGPRRCTKRSNGLTSDESETT